MTYLPNNADAERSVLGAIFLDPSRLDEITDILQPDDFYIVNHQKIYQAMLDIRDTGLDIISVSQRLKDKKELDNIGGLVFLNGTLSEATTAKNIEQYAAVVADLSARRKIYRAATAIANNALQTELGIDELRGESESAILSACAERTARQFSTPQNSLNLVFKDLMSIKDGKLDGTLSTGFKDLDEIIIGFSAGELIIIAGRPGMGKTSLALNLILNITQQVFPAGIISLEMPADQLIRRLLYQQAQIDAQAARTGRLDTEARGKITKAAGVLSERPWVIDDPSWIDITGLQSRARRMKSQFGIKILFVDYIGLVRGQRERGDSREREIASISAGLKRLAKELEIPVVALCQLNRESESQIRKDKRPRLSDLRESGSIEQDADTVLMIYREDYYDKQCDAYLSGVSEILVRKQRNGPEGCALLGWRSSCTSFVNLDPVSQKNYITAKPAKKRAAVIEGEF